MINLVSHIMDLIIERIYESKRQEQCVVIEKYVYSKSNTLVSRGFRFRCKNRKCSASIVINAALRKVLETN